MWRHFLVPLSLVAGCLISAFLFGMARGFGGESGAVAGLLALVSAAVLCVLEISLSFDNCVINASILSRMDAAWQNRFASWGIAVAALGMRFAFPLLMIVVSSGATAIDVLFMSLGDATVYQGEIQNDPPCITAFGGAFLMTVFFGFLFDDTRSVHWLGPLERPLSKLARIDGAAPVVAVSTLLVVQSFLPHEKRFILMMWGMIGVVFTTILKGISQLLSRKQEHLVRYAGFSGFLYLETMDASFSFDSVLTAFAVTNDLIVMAAGLSAGAFVIRSFAVLMVRRGAIKRLIFLEHGAHYAVGAFGFLLLSKAFPHVELPELTAPIVGAFFIGTAVISSILYRRKQTGLPDATVSNSPK